MERDLQWLTAGLAFTSAFCGLEAAGVPAPKEIILTVDGGGWQPITDAMELQSWWSGWSANFALLAAMCQISVVLVPRVIKMPDNEEALDLRRLNSSQKIPDLDLICTAVIEHLKQKGILK